MREITDIYDKDGKRTGKTMLRGEKPTGEEYITAAAAIVRSDRHILVTKRHPDKTHGNMWEFPGGGLRAGEEPLEALLRELKEETGIETWKEAVHFLKVVFYEPYHLFLHVYLVEADVKMNQLVLQKEEITKALFVTPQELKLMQQAFSPIDRQIFDELEKEHLFDS